MEIKGKISDVIILVLSFLIAIALIFIFKIHMVVANALLLAPPTSYLLIKYPKLRKRTILFGLPFAFVFTVIVDYLARTNFAWGYSPVFPLFIFPNIPLEIFAWWFVWTILIITVYETFIDIKHRNEKISRNYKFFIILLVTSFITFLLTLFANPPSITYFYAQVISLFIFAPLVYIFIKRPTLIPRVLKLSMFLFFFFLIYEIIGLKSGWWTFPGEYLGTVNILNVTIAIEELVLWILLGSFWVVPLFEEFADDLK